jgi:hypothetical protein
LLASVDISTRAPCIALNEQHVMACTSTKNCTGMQDSSWARCPQMEGHWKKKKTINSPLWKYEIIFKQSPACYMFLAGLILQPWIWRRLVPLKRHSTLNGLQDVISQKTELFFLRIYYLKSIVFQDMTPCSPLSFNRRFGGTYRLHLQGWTRTLDGYLLACWFLLNLFLRPWRWRRYVPPKRLKLNGLHGVISQKMILFIPTAVKPSNPTQVIIC